jgi:GTPase SAR1 family protein
MNALSLRAVDKCKQVKGVPFSEEVKYRQIMVLGPPGCGKSTLIRQIGGWPEEGYIDFTIKGWWASQTLAMRPREIHVGLPFNGFDHALTVYDREWLDFAQTRPLEVSKIFIPPIKKYFFSVDWRGRFVFEFLLPDPKVLLERRMIRAKAGTHFVDQDIDLATIRRQVEIFEHLAMFLHHQALAIYVRKNFDDPPQRIVSHYQCQN